MVLHQPLHQNRRSKGLNSKRILQFSLLAAVVVWLLYQVRHSHDKKVGYSESSENKHVDGLRELYLGRKGYTGIPVNNEKKNFEENSGAEEDGTNDSALQNGTIEESLNKELEEFQVDIQSQDEEENEVEQNAGEKISEPQSHDGDGMDDQLILGVEKSNEISEVTSAGEQKEIQEDAANPIEKESEKQMEQERDGGDNPEAETNTGDEGKDEVVSNKVQENLQQTTTQEHENNSSENSQNHISDDQTNKIITEEEEGSKEVISQDSVAKDGEISLDQQETAHDGDDFRDGNGVSEDERNSLFNEDGNTNQESVSSNQEGLSLSVDQNELSTNTSLEAQPRENAVPMTGEGDEVTSEAEKSDDSSLTEDKNATNVPVDNEASTGESLESNASKAETSVNNTSEDVQANAGDVPVEIEASTRESLEPKQQIESEAETSGNITSGDVKADSESNGILSTSSVSEGESDISMPIDTKNSTTELLKSEGEHPLEVTTRSNILEGKEPDQNLTMTPTDNEALQRELTESQANVAGNATSEDQKMESSSNEESDSTQVIEQYSEANDSGNASSEDQKMESSTNEASDSTHVIEQYSDTTSSLPGDPDNQIMLPTDNKDPERQAVVSEGDSAAEAGMVSNLSTKDVKLESSSDEGHGSIEVDDPSHEGTEQKDGDSESSTSASSTEAEESRDQNSHEQVGSEEHRKEEF